MVKAEPTDKRSKSPSLPSSEPVVADAIAGSAAVTPSVKAELLGKLSQMIEQSGGPREWALLSAWLECWLDAPLAELQGATPAQALASENGRRQVETLLERMRGGLPG